MDGCFNACLQLSDVAKPVMSQPVYHLQSFEAFIGTWKLDNSLQVFEWGPGKSSIIAKSYRIEPDGAGTLVSSGIWVWHPGEQEVKGYISATNMPVSFFEYSTEFENGSMVSQLSAYDRNGNKTVYREMMQLDTDTTYQWTLYRQQEAIMEGTFTLQRE